MRFLPLILLVACITPVPEAKCPNVGAQDPRQRVCQMASACSLIEDGAIPDCEYCVSIWAQMNNIDVESEALSASTNLSCEQLSKYGADSGVSACTKAMNIWRTGLNGVYVGE